MSTDTRLAKSGVSRPLRNIIIIVAVAKKILQMVIFISILLFHYLVDFSSPNVFRKSSKWGYLLFRYLSIC